MIKKLFTLLTLVLLAMPLAWGVDFYLCGSFNGWENIINSENSTAYKFTQSRSATYTLTLDNDLALPENAEFQIVKVDGNRIWFGAYSGYENISQNTSNIGTNLGGNNFKLKGAGATSFSFKYDGGWPYELEVTREPQLFIKGNFNSSWDDAVMEPMTQTSTGWTISKTISQGKEFRFIREWGEWLAWNGGEDNQNYSVGSDLLNGYEIPIVAGEKTYYMNVGGDFIIDVNSDFTKMVIYQPISLAQIQSSGDAGKTYIVKDDLQVVYVDSEKGFAIARDLTETTISCPSDCVDYITAVAEDHTGAWKQYNWVMLNITTPPSNESGFKNNCIIKGGSIKGTYNSNNTNYTINNVDGTAFTCVDGPTFTPNVYCPANFGPNTTLQQGGCYQETNYQVVNGASVDSENAIKYWFITPKPMEVFELSGALWYDGGFYMEKRMQATVNGKLKWFNPAGLKGGIGLGTSFNSTDNTGLTPGQSYRFLTLAWKPVQVNAPSYGAPHRISLEPETGQALTTSFQAQALNLGNGSSVVTGVSEVKSGSEVVSVTYCDLAGRMSQKPFAGVNIIVTRYSDGTVKTTKAIK